MITGEQLGGLLFAIHQHHHGDQRNGEILYFEEDLLPVLEKIGLPKPVWGKDNVQEYNPATTRELIFEAIRLLEEYGDVIIGNKIAPRDGQIMVSHSIKVNKIADALKDLL